ncbi:MAG: hypothetical protein DLM57_04605 [Pseudonocardiales bacterium]|nr:MAG: hypothetical protein DLM57_04605 [Pseudonocardiales bacterium]
MIVRGAVLEALAKTARALMLPISAALLVSGAAACGVGSHRSATPLVHRLEGVPVPGGAIRIAATHTDGDAEIGPKASLDYSLPAPLSAACPALLRGYLDAGYPLFEFSESQRPVADPGAFCAAQRQPQHPGDIVAVVVIAYPPGVKPGHPSDGVTAVLTDPIGGDRYRSGSHLRLSAS